MIQVKVLWVLKIQVRVSWISIIQVKVNMDIDDPGKDIVDIGDPGTGIVGIEDDVPVSVRSVSKQLFKMWVRDTYRRRGGSVLPPPLVVGDFGQALFRFIVFLIVAVSQILLRILSEEVAPFSSKHSESTF